jgi:hypothetical protein
MPRILILLSISLLLASACGSYGSSNPSPVQDADAADVGVESDSGKREEAGPDRDSSSTPVDAGVDARMDDPKQRFVFVTAKSYPANLSAGLSDPFQAIDSVCEAEANTNIDNTNLRGRKWRAYVSTAGVNAGNRVDGAATLRWERPDGKLVFAKTADISNSVFENPISDATVTVWTATYGGNYNGGGGSCLEWRSNDAAFSASVGLASAKNVAWTSSQYVGCSGLNKYYCFETR